MKMYISGSGGMLGDAYYKTLRELHTLHCSDINLSSPWLTKLDFRNYEEYYQDVKNFEPDILIHLGAHTDLEYCEKNIEDAYLTNTVSVEYATSISKKLNIPLVYISTAGIFDGQKEFYDDWDIPNPLGVYARTKYLGERFVVENSLDYIILRAGWMMGGGPTKDKKFVNKLIKQIKEGKTELYIVNDKDGTPTYTNDFAKNFNILLANQSRGLFNMVCNGLTSRYEVAKELINFAGLDERIKLNIVDSSYFDNLYFAPRPPNERLINSRLNLLRLNKMDDWKTSLHRYLNEYDWNLNA
jgi:dTDP-4-dehydrorhamnose reductase